MRKTLTKKILVSGYYGYNNIGDEAILEGLVDGISSKTDAQLLVLSRNPDWTKAKYGVESIDRNNIFQLIKAIRKVDMVISGGGSLLQDVTSKKSILYYLAILKLAMLFKKKTFIYSQGIGPIRLKRNRILTKNILSKVDYINVRDNQSYRELKELGIKREVLVTTDTVFGINQVDLKKGKEILEKIGVDKNKKNICFTIMNWKSYGNQIKEKIVKTIELILSKRNDVNIIFVPFFYHVDLQIQSEIFESIKNSKDNIYIVEDYLHVKEYLSLIGNMDIMLSMRLHGLIFATLMGAYPIGISYDPKIDGFMKELNRVQKYYVEDFKPELLSNEIIESIDKLEDLKEETKSYLNKFYKLASIHNDAVNEVLER